MYVLQYRICMSQMDIILISLYPQMKAIRKYLATPKTIIHMNIQFPIKKKSTERINSLLDLVDKKTPALFFSINGPLENPEVAHYFRETIRLVKEIEKIPVYGFLQDGVNGLTYYIATAADVVCANPYCMIGDLTVPIKTYKNIHKLLEAIGISYENLGTQKTYLWNSQVQQSPKQLQVTDKWLTLITSRLKQTIANSRKIPIQKIPEFGNKLLHPRQALQLKLIDKICTVEQYRDIYFPNHRISHAKIFTRMRKIDFNYRELQVLVRIAQAMSVGAEGMGMAGLLMKMEGKEALVDVQPELVNQFLSILEDRINDEERLGELDEAIGRILEKKEIQIADGYKLIV